MHSSHQPNPSFSIRTPAIICPVSPLALLLLLLSSSSLHSNFSLSLSHWTLVQSSAGGDGAWNNATGGQWRGGECVLGLRELPLLLPLQRLGLTLRLLLLWGGGGLPGRAWEVWQAQHPPLARQGGEEPAEAPPAQPAHVKPLLEFGSLAGMHADMQPVGRRAQHAARASRAAPSAPPPPPLLPPAAPASWRPMCLHQRGCATRAQSPPPPMRGARSGGGLACPGRWRHSTCATPGAARTRRPPPSPAAHTARAAAGSAGGCVGRGGGGGAAGGGGVRGDGARLVPRAGRGAQAGVRAHRSHGQSCSEAMPAKNMQHE